MLDRIADGRTDLVFDHVNNCGPATAVVQRASLIQHCAYYGDVSAIKFLLAHGATLATLGENFDLNGACYHGHWRLCQFLIEQGADVNHALPDTGETPLHSVLCKTNRVRYTPLVRILLAAGADPNRPTIPGVETGSFMRDCRTKGETPLHRAAAFGNEEDVQLLLDAGAKVESRDANGETPLSWASWYLRSGAMLHLLCYGDYWIRPERRQPSSAEPPTGSMEQSLTGTPHLGPAPAK
ncbi:MAG: hypothetical protein FJW30_21665 [Acidobacteria bacterium]|nr:hypothetical protein [Acidobacteriota bacterium]